MLAVALVVVAAAKAAALSATVHVLIDEEERWLARLQLADGSIPMARGNTRIVPYFTNLGLMGLADNPAYADTVRRWIEWYTSNLNRPDALGVMGTIYDHEVSYGRARPTRNYDSSDAYAATFLTLVRAYYDTTGDAELLRAIESDLRLVAGAVHATMDPADGLTYAKPDYPVKYLMDNAEVYRGLVDWSYLLQEVFGDEEGARKVQQDAGAVRESLLAMWRGTGFAYAKDPRGQLYGPNWQQWYPDAVAQLFPIWAGVLAPDDPRAVRIWETFNAHHAQWTVHGHPDPFPGAVVGYVAALMGDWERVEAYVQTIDARYRRLGRPWPWFVAEAGWYLRMLKAYAAR